MGLWYRKVVPALDETARARLWGPLGAESFDSTTSFDELDELADLVDSFYDSDYEWSNGNEKDADDLDCVSGADMLDATLEEMRNDLEGDRIRVEVENVIGVIGSDSDSRLLRRAIKLLREKGVDAGLCKSFWEQSQALPARSHKYIDVITSDASRYIVEINLASNFDIARPSEEYTPLMQRLPALFIGRPEHLKSIVNIMSNAAVESIKTAGMHVPPWRRKEYVLAKWFSSHKRLLNFGGVKMGMENRGTDRRLK